MDLTYAINAAALERIRAHIEAAAAMHREQVGGQVACGEQGMGRGGGREHGHPMHNTGLLTQPAAYTRPIMKASLLLLIGLNEWQACWAGVPAHCSPHTDHTHSSHSQPTTLAMLTPVQASLQLLIELEEEARQAAAASVKEGADGGEGGSKAGGKKSKKQRERERAEAAKQREVEARRAAEVAEAERRAAEVSLCGRLCLRRRRGRR